MNKETLQQIKDEGITLIGLIISIIILVILTAVSLRVAVKNGMLDLATDGVRKLCKRAKK